MMATITRDDILFASALLLCLGMFLTTLGVIRWAFRVIMKLIQKLNSLIE